MNKGLAKKIDEMTQRDQDMRLRVQKGGEWDYSIDRLNTEELKQVITRGLSRNMRIMTVSFKKKYWIF